MKRDNITQRRTHSPRSRGQWGATNGRVERRKRTVNSKPTRKRNGNRSLKKRLLKLLRKGLRSLVKLVGRHVRQFIRRMRLLPKRLLRKAKNAVWLMFTSPLRFAKKFLLPMFKYVPLLWLALVVIARGLESKLTQLFTNVQNWSFTSVGHFAPTLSGRNVIVTALGRDSVVTSNYGRRYLNGHTFHHGIDVRAKTGDEVFSVIDGKVVAVNDTVKGRGGRYVLIRSTDDNTEYFVCHLSEIKVKVGDKVSKGDLIAKVGGSGLGKEVGYAPHLHLELRRKVAKGKYVAYNPLEYDGTSTTSTTLTSATSTVTKSRKPHTLPQTDKENDIGYGVIYLVNKMNITPQQACGIVGNLMTESNMNPCAWNTSGGGRGAQGLAQWRGSRISTYKSKYGREPKDDGSMVNQFDYIVYEFEKGKYLEGIRKCDDIASATDYVMSRYERPSGRASYPSRLANANRAYEIYTKYGKTYQTVVNNYNTSTYNIAMLR